MNRPDFQHLAVERLEDAQALLLAGRYSGAYYVSGYAIECAFKACIAAKTKQDDFPPKDAASYYIHNLTDLLNIAVKIAGLKKEWDDARKADPNFDANWAVVKDWTEEARYQVQVRTQQEAEALYSAISDPHHGVLPWLRRFW
jgi:HEPN domain-containing protein